MSQVDSTAARMAPIGVPKPDHQISQTLYRRQYVTRPGSMDSLGAHSVGNAVAAHPLIPAYSYRPCHQLELSQAWTCQSGLTCSRRQLKDYGALAVGMVCIRYQSGA